MFIFAQCLLTIVKSASSSILARWFESENCVAKDWKEESMEIENRANWNEDKQTITFLTSTETSLVLRVLVTKWMIEKNWLPRSQKSIKHWIMNSNTDRLSVSIYETWHSKNSLYFQWLWKVSIMHQPACSKIRTSGQSNSVKAASKLLGETGIAHLI